MYDKLYYFIYLFKIIIGEKNVKGLGIYNIFVNYVIFVKIKYCIYI